MHLVPTRPICQILKVNVAPDPKSPPLDYSFLLCLKRNTTPEINTIVLHTIVAGCGLHMDGRNSTTRCNSVDRDVKHEKTTKKMLCDNLLSYVSCYVMFS